MAQKKISEGFPVTVGMIYSFNTICFDFEGWGGGENGYGDT